MKINSIHRYVCEEGATAVEYCIIMAIISGVLVGALFLFGDDLEVLFDESLPTIMAQMRERLAE